MRRYLAFIGVVHHGASGSALAEFTRAHLLYVPFENITSLLRRVSHAPGPVPPPDVVAVLSNWGERRGGGVCYEHTASSGGLLGTLGYRATLLIGQVTFPASHRALVIDLEGRRLLVDVGNGAPLGGGGGSWHQRLAPNGVGARGCPRSA